MRNDVPDGRLTTLTRFCCPGFRQCVSKPWHEPGSGTFLPAKLAKIVIGHSYRPYTRQLLCSHPLASTAMQLASRPCQAIGQRRFGSARGILPLRKPSIRARVASVEPVAPAKDERGFILKEVGQILLSCYVRELVVLMDCSDAVGAFVQKC